MKRVALALAVSLLLANSGAAAGLDINPQELQQIVAQNPQDVPNRLLLVRYYLNHYQFDKAEKYLKEAEKIAPNSPEVKKIEKIFKERRAKYEAIQQVFKPITAQYGSLDDYITTLYNEGKYKEMRDFYLRYGQFLHLSDSSWIKLAKVFDWAGQYKTTAQILSKLKDKSGLDYYTLKADVAFNLGDYKTAIYYYNLLFKLTGDPTFGKRLAQLYIWQGDLERAEKVLLMMERRVGKGKGQGKSKNSDIQKLWEEIKKKKEEYIQKVKEQYLKSPTFANLQSYVYAVADKNLTKGIPIVLEHLEKHPNDKQARFFLAELYAWTDQYPEAVEVLKKLKNDKEAQLLMAKILSWEGKYPEAEEIFKRYSNDSNSTIAYEAQKGLALVYAWSGKKEKALKLLKKLHKLNPKDKEVNLQLLLLEGKPADLIRYYRQRLKKNPNDSEALLGLGDVYYKLKKYRLAAKYYERYLTLNPQKLEVYKLLGDSYLQLKDFYKGFSNWEYYAYMKGTKEAYLELAKRYYWYGFNNEALKVLNDLLNRYPTFKEARLLKAQVLKINPRFVVASSAATFEQYLNNRSKKLEELGDRAYFNGFYESAIKYYWTILSWNPDNYDVREKYAYALEYTGRYKDAAGEFFMLMWMKKNPQIEYNYAFCLQKSGKIKQAKQVYEKLLKEVPRPAPLFIRLFLKGWKKAFESMDSYKLIKFYSKKLADSPGWRIAKDRFFQKQVWVALSYFDPIVEETVQKGDKTIFKTRIWEVISTKYIKNRGRYRYLWIECPTNVVEKWKQEEDNYRQQIVEWQSIPITQIEGKNSPVSWEELKPIIEAQFAQLPSSPISPSPIGVCKIVKERLVNGKFEKFNPKSSLYYYIQQNLYYIKKKGSFPFPIQ